MHYAKVFSQRKSNEIVFFEYPSNNKTNQNKEMKISETIKRRKILILEDQRKSVLAWEMHRDHLKFGRLSCRNPFKIDETLINYELDSEDELAEENGEDIDGEKNSEDEESDDE
jgi:hypothetical protein